MTNEKLYRNLKLLESFLKEDCFQDNGCVSAQALVSSMIVEVEQDIRNQANKASKNASIAKAAEGILNYAQKNITNPVFHKAYKGAQYLYVCDTFRLVRFNILTAPTLPMHDIKFDAYPDCDRIIPKDYTREIELPDINTLTAFIKLKKAEIRAKKGSIGPVYELVYGAHVIKVGAEYLLSMLQCLPEAKAKISSKNCELKGILFEASNGVGILMPVRRTE